MVNVKLRLFITSFICVLGIVFLAFGLSGFGIYLINIGNVLSLIGIPVLTVILLDFKRRLLKLSDIITIGAVSSFVTLMSILFAFSYFRLNENPGGLTFLIVALSSVISSFMFIFFALYRKNEEDVSSSIMR